MPALFGQVRLDNALDAEALPALERLAAYPNYLEATRRRFDNDDDEPPPYVSSTEEEEDEPPPPHPLDLDAILDAPLPERHLDVLARHMAWEDRPGGRYKQEVRIEEERIRRFEGGSQYNRKRKNQLYTRQGHVRQKIIARHFVRKRWQKLGVWNSQWAGFGAWHPMHGTYEGVNPRNKPDPDVWKWSWEADGAVREEEWKKRPGARAVFLRRSLRRGEHYPLPPRSSVTEDTSASQAESFITSRPWFMFHLEMEEEQSRQDRVPRNARPTHTLSMYREVKSRWEERGDWRDEWSEFGAVGWRWRHEGPEPALEDLAQLNDIDDLELTPSEAEALEAVPSTPPPFERMYNPLAGSPPPGSIFARTGPAPRSPSPPSFAGSAAAAADVVSPNASSARPPRPSRHQPGRSHTTVRQHGRPLRRSARIAARLAPPAPPAPPATSQIKHVKRQRTAARQPPQDNSASKSAPQEPEPSAATQAKSLQAKTCRPAQRPHSKPRKAAGPRIALAEASGQEPAALRRRVVRAPVPPDPPGPPGALPGRRSHRASPRGAVAGASA